MPAILTLSSILAIIRQAAKGAKDTLDVFATCVNNNHEFLLDIRVELKSRKCWKKGLFWSHRADNYAGHGRGNFYVDKFARREARREARHARREEKRCFSSFRSCQNRARPHHHFRLPNNNNFWLHNKSITRPRWHSTLPRAGSSWLQKDEQHHQYKFGFVGYKGLGYQQLNGFIYSKAPSQVLKNLWVIQSRTFITDSNTWSSRLNKLPAFSIIQDIYSPGPLSSSPHGSSIVDFELTPRLTLPAVSELTDDVIDTISRDIDAFAQDLKNIAADIKRIGNLGELPISVERNNGVLRVHFPNSDTSKVATLLADADVSRGVILNSSESDSYSDQVSDFSYRYSTEAMDTGSSDGYCLSFSDSDIPTPGLTNSGSSFSSNEPISEVGFIRT